jgi:DUF438 domain-containing protein
MHMMMVVLKLSMFCPMLSKLIIWEGWYNNTKHNQNIGFAIINTRLLRRAVKIGGNLFMILSFFVV